MTSTLQQEASRKLRCTSQRRCARPAALRERLHHLHAHRLDELSESALTAARAQAAQLYGDEYVPDGAAALRAQGEERAGGARGDPPGRATPSGRPAPSSLSSRDEHALYELIWKRPSPRRWRTPRADASLRIGATASDGGTPSSARRGR